MTGYSYDRRVTAATTPVPSRFPDDEIGLMTRDEFLKFKNPGDKHHPSSAYDWELMELNRDLPHRVGEMWDRSSKFYISKLSEGYRVDDDNDKLVGVIHDGIGYYDDPRMKDRFPREAIGDRGRERTDLGVRSTKHVKYLSEYMPLVSPIAKLNENRYPVVLQHIIVHGEPFTVRAEKQPKQNAQTSLAILNHEGYVVAVGQDEWGATLLSVVKEYRGKGLGKLIGQYWYEYNPASGSGGFTSSGKRNAIALWKERVREFAGKGWYSQLVRDGRITQERVKEILKQVGVREKKPEEPVPADVKVKPTGEILVFADDISFIIYDRAFLDEQDERFIHGFGFFRDADVGVFLFRIEYDRPFAQMATRIALQMARNNGDRLYDGGGYNDLLEDVDKLPGVVRDGDYLEVTRDLEPGLRAMASKEKRLRKAVDPYDEKFYSLQELANSKWN